MPDWVWRLDNNDQPVRGYAAHRDDRVHSTITNAFDLIVGKYIILWSNLRPVRPEVTCRWRCPALFSYAHVRHDDRGSVLFFYASKRKKKMNAISTRRVGKKIPCWMRFVRYSHRHHVKSLSLFWVEAVAIGHCEFVSPCKEYFRFISSFFSSKTNIGSWSSDDDLQQKITLEQILCSSQGAYNSYEKKIRRIIVLFADG